jgi:hypothetical protein
LSCYCLAWSRLLEAEKHLEAEGAVVDGRQDGKVKNPWATIANQAMDQIRKLGAEFGLTPSSRPPARSASQGTHPGGDCSGAGRGSAGEGKTTFMSSCRGSRSSSQGGNVVNRTREERGHTKNGRLIRLRLGPLKLLFGPVAAPTAAAMTSLYHLIS